MVFLDTFLREGLLSTQLPFITTQKYNTITNREKCSYDALIIVRVIYDMARVQRDYIISLFNNRVHPNLNTVTTQKIGLSKEETIYHAAALQKIWHFIYTSFGVSLEYLIWGLINNPEVLGQGNGGGPASFRSLMLPLEKAYKYEINHGVDYTNPDSTMRFSQWIISHVDNNTILVKLENLGYKDTAEQMIVVTCKCLGIW